MCIYTQGVHTRTHQFQFQFQFVYSQPIRIEAVREQDPSVHTRTHIYMNIQANLPASYKGPWIHVDMAAQVYMSERPMYM